MEYLNKKIRKEFAGHGFFSGEVVKVEVGDAFPFTIKYEDGDTETVDLPELEQILVPAQGYREGGRARKPAKTILATSTDGDAAVVPAAEHKPIKDADKNAGGRASRNERAAARGDHRTGNPPPSRDVTHVEQGSRKRKKDVSAGKAAKKKTKATASAATDAAAHAAATTTTQAAEVDAGANCSSLGTKDHTDDEAAMFHDAEEDKQGIRDGLPHVLRGRAKGQSEGVQPGEDASPCPPALHIAIVANGATEPSAQDSPGPSQRPNVQLKPRKAKTSPVQIADRNGVHNTSQRGVVGGASKHQGPSKVSEQVERPPLANGMEAGGSMQAVQTGKEASPGPCPAAQAAPQAHATPNTTQQIFKMVTRLPKTENSILRMHPATGGRPNTTTPLYHQVVVRGNTVYLAGQTASDTTSATGQTYAGQAKQVFAKIDRLLKDAGSCRSLMLTALVHLRDVQEGIDAFNAAWVEWFEGDSGNAPTRTTVQAHMVMPDLLVEVTVTAAMNDN